MPSDIPIATSKSVAKRLAVCHPKIARGIVWCTVCGRSQKVNAEQAFQTGWPMCCEQTMTIDSPEERKP